MATGSNIFSGFTTAKYQTLYLVFNQVSQDIANNRTLFSYQAYIQGNVSGASGSTLNGSYTISGATSSSVTGKSWSWTNTTKQIIASDSFYVNHNADGTLTTQTLSISVSFATTSGTATSSTSASLTVATIPRASTPTLSNASPVMNTSITISTNRASTSFTHTLKYQFGSYSGTIENDVGVTSQAWTVPLDFANAVPNATSGVGAIICETYNGATLIGTKTVNFTASVPDSVVPVINSVIITEAVEGLATQFGGFVQNKSKLRVQLSGDGAYSSTITNSLVSVDRNYTGHDIVSELIADSGPKQIMGWVQDSRGRVVTQTEIITIFPYTNPTITRLSAYRANASGGADDNGTSIAVSMKFNVAPVNNGTTDKNTKSWTLKYRIAGVGEFVQFATGSVYSYDSTYTNSSVVLSADNSYEIQLTVTDYFTSVSQIVNIGTTFTLINFNASGRGVAFGKASEISNGFELAMAPTFIGGLPAVSVNGKDMNTVTETGFYYGHSATNTGSNDTISSFMVIKYSEDWITQIQFAQESNSRIFIRSRHDGTTWSTWRQI